MSYILVMPSTTFLCFSFYKLFLEMLENSKTVRNFRGDEKVFVVNFYLNFIYCPRKPNFPLLKAFQNSNDFSACSSE